MQKTTFATIYFAFFAFSLFAYASPVANEVAVARADPITTVLGIVTDLKNKVETLLGGGLHATTDVAGLIAQLVATINPTVTAIKSVGTVATVTNGAQDGISDIATIVAGIINTILAAIQSLPLGGLLNILNLATLDLALQSLLGGLSLVIPGVLVLVTSLLALPVGLLSGILGLLLPGLFGILNI